MCLFLLFVWYIQIALDEGQDELGGGGGTPTQQMPPSEAATPIPRAASESSQKTADRSTKAPEVR